MRGDIISNATQILIGIRPNGVMTVIADWPQKPPLTEVQEEIDRASVDYVTFALCGRYQFS